MGMIELTCPKCKADLQLEDDVLICPYCGAKILIRDDISAKIKKEEGKTKVKLRQIEAEETKEVQKEKSSRFSTAILALLMVIFLGICGVMCLIENKQHEGEVTTTVAAKEYKGEQYDDVVKDLEHIGFNNITAKPERDLVVGLINKENQVISVSINGDKKFKEDETFPSDANVLVIYHAYKNKD